MTRRRRTKHRASRREQQQHDAALKAVDEFYVEVAQSFELPPKELPPPPAAARPLPGPLAAWPPPPRRTREEVLRAIGEKPALLQLRARLLPALAVLLLIVTGAYFFWPAGTGVVPEDFRGTWVSRNPMYAGRMMVISMETIEIVAGRDEATGPLVVTSSKIDTTAEGTRLRIVYGPARSEQRMELILHSGPRATLTLARPADVVWERYSGAAASSR